MINAWSLAASVLNNTLDKDYPIMDKTKGRWNEDVKITPQESDEYDIPHSDYYYDYTRNDPDAKNPFTDPEDRKRADKVVGKLDEDLDWIANNGGFEWTPGSPWPPTDPDYPYGRKSADLYAHSVEKAYDDFYGEGDDLDYENILYDTCSGDDYMADVDDQRAHHFNFYGDKKMDYEPQRNHQYKYHEEEILKDIEEYVSRTYQGHYTGTKHEFRKVQTIDLMAARDIAAQFCQANILKYGSRYGSKDGRNKKDLLKVIHYAMLLLHFDGHYGEPSMPTDEFDQMP